MCGKWTTIYRYSHYAYKLTLAFKVTKTIPNDKHWYDTPYERIPIFYAYGDNTHV